MPIFESLTKRARGIRVAVIVALAAPAALFAAEEKKELSFGEKAAEAFGKIGVISKEEKPNWDAALDILNALAPQLAPESYDLAHAMQMKGKLLLQREEYTKAIEPLELALKISDARQYFEPGEALMLSDLLARLYAQEASGSKTPAAQDKNFSSSINYFRRVLKDTPKQNPDTILTFAQVLVQYATLNSEKINIPLIKEARASVERVLHSTIKPKESAYALLQFTIQAEGDIPKSTELLELLVKQYPAKSSYWGALMQSYMTLAQANEKDPEKMQRYYVRAINTIERAQPYGFLKEKKDNYNLVTLYTLAGQFGRSTELLHAGLKNGTVDSDVKNWRQLAYAYQQANLELQAINALKEAIALFPKAGQLDFDVGNIYYGLDDIKNANAFFRSAVEKGGVERLYATLMFIAYSSLELGELDVALETITKAGKMPESEKDQSYTRMKEAIENNINERAEKAKEREAKNVEAAAATPKKAPNL